MEAWRDFSQIEEYGESLRGVLSSKENQVNNKNIESELLKLMNRLDAYSFSYSDEMRMWKEGLFSWLHKLLELAQKVSFCFLFDA